MRVRTGHGPEEWSTNEPATPYTHKRRGASVPVLPIPDMRPLLTTGGNFISAGAVPRLTINPTNLPERQARIAHELAGSPKPECGYVLPVAGDRCARKPGHRDSHRSRWVMDNDKLARQTGRSSGSASHHGAKGTGHR